MLINLLPPTSIISPPSRPPNTFMEEYKPAECSSKNPSSLLIFLRKKVLESFLKSRKDISDNFFDKKGIGEIKNSKVFYKGTYWEIDSNLNAKEFVEGEKVEVLKTSNNMATIQKR